MKIFIEGVMMMYMKRVLSSSLLLSFLACFLVLFSVEAFAQTVEKTPGLSISPAFQEVVFEKNDTEQSIFFELENNTDQTLEFRFEAIPYTTVDYVGSLSFLNPTLNEAVGTVSFVTFDVDRVMIEAKSKKKIDVHVQNRPNLSPGGHYIAIVSRLVSEEDAQQKIIPAVGSLLMIHKKDGEQVNLSLRSVENAAKGVVFHLADTVELSFENQGNIHVTPRGTITVTDLFNRVVQQGTINENSSLVLPGMRRIIGVKMATSRRVVPISFLTLDVKGTVQGHESGFTHQSSYFYIAPWILVVGTLLIICLPLSFLFLKKRKHARQNNQE